MIRGDIWWVDFGEPLGSEPGWRRPAVIVQSDSSMNMISEGIQLVLSL